MNVQTRHVNKSEDEELAKRREELAGLESELTESELQVAGLRAALSVFERRYLEVVGVRYAKLDDIEAQIAEQLARNSPSDAEAQKKAKEVRDYASFSHEEAFSTVPGQPKDFTPSPTLKTLYREVAKKVHPDLTSDPLQRAKRQSLMADANRAYEQGDEARLRKILEEYESSPETVEGEGTGAELVRVIRKIAQIKRRIGEINAEIEQLTQSEIYQLKTRAEKAETEGGDLFKEMGQMVERQIASAETRLQEALKTSGA